MLTVFLNYVFILKMLEKKTIVFQNYFLEYSDFFLNFMKFSKTFGAFLNFLKSLEM